HPDLAEELRSYFAGCDELELLCRPANAGSATEHISGPVPEEPAAEGGTRQVGDYELLGQLGEGGMGIIYKARQRSLQRLVALKMIRPDRLASPADILRFRSEAEAVASLDHPHIVPIYEV